MSCYICRKGTRHYVEGKSICQSCEEQAKTLVTLTDNNDSSSSSNSTKPFHHTLEQVKEMNEMEGFRNEQIQYLSGFADAFNKKLYADIRLKSGDNGPFIVAHKSLLVATSKVFESMIPKDTSNEITLPELNHDQLESLVEFLYSGSLPKEKMEKHVYSLMSAAKKYNIPYLKRLCEEYLLGSLNVDNALDILEIFDECSNENLTQTVIEFIDRNMCLIVTKERFDAFSATKPELVAKITMAAISNSNKGKRKAGV